MAGFLALAGQIEEHGIELWPRRHGEELGCDPVIRQVGKAIFRTRKLGVVARDLIPSKLEERFIKIAFLGFFQSIDRFLEIEIDRNRRARSRVLYGASRKRLIFCRELAQDLGHPCPVATPPWLEVFSHLWLSI